MLKEIECIVDYVQKKVNYNIKESQTTNSVYLEHNWLKIRLSDHIANDRQIQIIVCEWNTGYCVVTYDKVLYYKSYKPVCEMIISYYFMSTGYGIISKVLSERDSISKNYVNLTTLQTKLKEENAELKKENSKLRSSVNNTQQKIDSLESKKNTYLESKKDLEELCSKYKDKIDGLTTTNKQLKADCQEAAQLLGEILNKETREALIKQNKDKVKTYFIDNFPQEAQDLIKEIITEYYGK